MSISYQHDFSLRLVNMSVEDMARGLTQRLLIGGGKHPIILPQNLTAWTKIPREIIVAGSFLLLLLCFVLFIDLGGCYGWLSSFPFWGQEKGCQRVLQPKNPSSAQ